MAGAGTDLPGTKGRLSTGLNKMISPVAESDGREPFGQRNSAAGVDRNSELDLNYVDTLNPSADYSKNPKQGSSKR